MAKTLTQTEVAKRIGQLRQAWQETAEGENLLDVKASVGFLLFDLTETFDLTQSQSKAALGDRLYTDAGEVINGKDAWIETGELQ